MWYHWRITCIFPLTTAKRRHKREDLIEDEVKTRALPLRESRGRQPGQNLCPNPMVLISDEEDSQAFRLFPTPTKQASGRFSLVLLSLYKLVNKFRLEGGLQVENLIHVNFLRCYPLFLISNFWCINHDSNKNDLHIKRIFFILIIRQNMMD